MNLNIFLVGTLSVLAGIIIGYLVRQIFASRLLGTAEEKAKTLLENAKTKAKEEALTAKDKALSITEKAKKEESQRRKRLVDIEAKLSGRENKIDRRYQSIEYKERTLRRKENTLDREKEEIESIKEKKLKILEKISQLDRERARELLLKLAEKASKERLFRHLKSLEEHEKEAIEAKSKEILSLAMERQASPHTAESTSTIVELPSDEMKGRIIGREGRNIKAIERLTGTEIVVDDTPEVITVSGFSPVRRHVAKLALEKLISDGRIHPARVEEAVEKARTQIAQDIRKAGEEACFDVGVAGLDPKLVQILGRLKYRSSYGQNVLRHSIEVANIAAVLSEELEANTALCRKAGLLHDIGKAVDHEVQGTHVEIGRDIAKKFKLSDEVIHAIEAHHEDVDFKSTEAIIVATADAISGARMGARKDTYEDYIKRLEELEGIANSFEGVEKSYAIQAGREIRIFVNAEEISDLQSLKLSREIADKIEEELKYPGEIKVNIIRETRAVEYAR